MRPRSRAPPSTASSRDARRIVRSRIVEAAMTPRRVLLVGRRLEDRRDQRAGLGLRRLSGVNGLGGELHVTAPYLIDTRQGVPESCLRDERGSAARPAPGCGRRADSAAARAASSAARCTRAQPASAIARAPRRSPDRESAGRLGSRAGSDGEVAGDVLDQLAALGAAARWRRRTAVRSDPPRPSDRIAPPALTARKPGTIATRACASAASMRSGRTRGAAVGRHARPALMDVERLGADAEALKMERQPRDRSQLAGRPETDPARRPSAPTAIACASSSSASVAPYSAETITTSRLVAVRSEAPLDESRHRVERRGVAQHRAANLDTHGSACARPSSPSAGSGRRVRQPVAASSAPTRGVDARGRSPGTSARKRGRRAATRVRTRRQTCRAAPTCRGAADRPAMRTSQDRSAGRRGVARSYLRDGADGTRSAPRVTTSTTSSSSVAAVTSGPAPGPSEALRAADRIEQMPFVAPLTRASGWLPARKPARRTRAGRPFDHVACASGFSVPPSARAARRSRGIDRRRARRVESSSTPTMQVRELPKQQRELFRGVAPADVARRIRLGKPEALRVAAAPARRWLRARGCRRSRSTCR